MTFSSAVNGSLSAFLYGTLMVRRSGRSQPDGNLHLMADIEERLACRGRELGLLEEEFDECLKS